MLPRWIIDQITERLTNPSGCWRDYNSLYSYWVALNYEAAKGNINVGDVPEAPNLDDYTNTSCVFAGPETITATYSSNLITVAWSSVWNISYYVVNKSVNDSEFEVLKEQSQTNQLYEVPSVNGRYRYRVYAVDKGGRSSTVSETYVDVNDL